MRTLVSWKEIRPFLDRAERTVKRWERERGLPVHRVPAVSVETSLPIRTN